MAAQDSSSAYFAVLRAAVSSPPLMTISTIIKTCEAGLVLSVTRILRRIPCVCMYVCDKTPPKPLNLFA